MPGLRQRKVAAIRRTCNRRMPWTPERYPASMRNLPEPVRRKAVEIANALLRQGMEEGKAIRVATAGARRRSRAAGPGGFQTSSGNSATAASRQYRGPTLPAAAGEQDGHRRP